MEARIHVFFTGGTIGMTPAPGCPGVAPGGTFQSLLENLALPPQGLRLNPVAWADKPSPHMTPSDMLALSRDLDAALAQPGSRGAVVLHGTDVLVETAYLLDLTLASALPVVCTGAMRYYAECGFDGLRNLVNSLRACLALPQGGGASLLMTDRLFAARTAVKVNSLNIDAFEAREDGVLGSVAGESLVLAPRAAAPRTRRVLSPAHMEANVPLVTCATGMDGAVLDWHRDQGARGLVLEGFGAGNVPPGMVPAVERCLDAGLPVALASRCIEGGVWPLYAYPGGGADLEAKGVMLSGRLGAPRARLLLMALLGCGLQGEALRRAFAEMAG